MVKKAQVNYLLDIVIGIAFVIVAVSGIAFLFMGSGGYQGGSNPNFATEWLSIARSAWSDLHTLSGLVMMAGVGVHLLLHWQWIICMTKQTLKITPRRKETACPVE